MSDDPKNIFISHIHEDDKVLQDLKDLLSRNGYEIRDSSIDSSKPNEAKDENYIKTQILGPRICWASTVVVLISPNTHTSDWVNWEIEHAHNQGKRIVGVCVQGGQECNMPVAFDEYGDVRVGWQADRVMDAINGKINDWVPDDKSELPARAIPRYSC